MNQLKQEACQKTDSITQHTIHKRLMPVINQPCIPERFDQYH